MSDGLSRKEREELARRKQQKMYAAGGVLILVLLLCVVAFNKLVTTVERGTYHIKQAAVTGEITAHMNPGMYGLFFGDYTEWPVAESFFFTADSDEGNDKDESIQVRFNDGASTNISGTCRVNLPRTEEEAAKLVTESGYRDFNALEQKLILPTIRKSLVVTANLMSAKESYSDRRSDFYSMAWDQIENGVYKTRDETVKVEDVASGKLVTKTRKVVLTDEDGHPVRERNPLEGTGITLSNFEVKRFVYEPRVRAQIEEQQKALMAVQTARANAQKAEQDAITAEAQGKNRVMEAKYKEEEEKIRAEVKAEKDASVANIEAQKKVDVAEKTKEEAIVRATQTQEVAAIELEAAKLEKERQIELGTGEAERKRLVLEADGALSQKLDAWVKSQQVWAQAYSTRKVPSVVMSGESGMGAPGGDSEIQTFMKVLGVNAASDLALKMKIDK